MPKLQSPSKSGLFLYINLARQAQDRAAGHGSQEILMDLPLQLALIAFFAQ